MAAIDYTLKRKCVELANQGVTYRDIYQETFSPQHDGMSYDTFKRKMHYWRKKKYADDVTLEVANLDWSFKPYAATVQVNGNGDVVQSWVKQSAIKDNQFAELLAEIKANTEPVKIECTAPGESSHMLEIPLYDMHLGIADLDYYRSTIYQTVRVINSQKWAKILVPIGQDLFHNDDFRGRTSSGRQIEQVNIVQAWNDAKAIYYRIIDEAYANADDVEIVYIRGNHDESLSWAFVQMLAERYTNVDDSLDYKKVRTFGKCFIGLTHGDAKKSSAQDLRNQFTIKFPVEFAGADIREIHAGHLHHEKESDIYGVMVRRLCTGAMTDDWSASEGFEGAHKRFMLFDWSLDKLAAIHYV